MVLDTDILSRFKGGQYEVQNPGEHYIIRGEIKDARVENGILKIRFVWLAIGKDGYPVGPIKWTNYDDRNYSISLKRFKTTHYIGNNCIAMSSPVFGEMARFYSPDGEKLDPKDVEGLPVVA